MLIKLKLWALAVAGVLLTVWSFYAKGQSSAQRRQEQERLEDYVQTRKAIDAAPDAVDDAGGGRQWLYERQRKRGGDM